MISGEPRAVVSGTTLGAGREAFQDGRPSHASATESIEGEALPHAVGARPGAYVPVADDARISRLTPGAWPWSSSPRHPRPGRSDRQARALAPAARPHPRTEGGAAVRSE